MLDGRLALTTPEGVRLLLTPAGPAARACAWAVDFLLWLAFVACLTTLLRFGRLGSGLFGILLFVSFWGYPILCEVYWAGRTVGKRTFGIEVLRADGLPVGWRESTLRNLMLVADFLPMVYAGGLVCMLCDLRFRRLGDIVAGTLVVYSEPPARRAETPLAGAPPLALPFALSAQQQRTLTDLFEREAHLPPDRMSELGDLAQALTGHTGQASVERLRRYVAGWTQ